MRAPRSRWTGSARTGRRPAETTTPRAVTDAGRFIRSCGAAGRAEPAARVFQCRTSAIIAPKPTNRPPVSRLNAFATFALRSVTPIRVPNDA
ncbi:homoserine/homoserine lactone efflux domain protein [Burkholderia pseudomallei MSHR5492]|nr:homoserine/homoserine lactone efflux domain protein [Burkholderia pseudomallei MSHR5569]KGS37881.1 homoserine/homoserine lactone efflux domain protein [Burkholderia pseudomallei MSHR5492]KGX51086.1 homoserine/homoserine lactone efflux domain protein [Burkholderia pseudomallei TSV32]